MAKKLEKIFATALASFTLLSLAGCGGGGESHSKEKKIDATYSLEAATLDGVSVKDDFQLYNADFNEDGTLTVLISYLGLIETRNSTYVYTDNTIVEKYNSNTYEYTVYGDTLKTTMQDFDDVIEITLKKETDESKIQEVDFESVLFGEDISQTKYFNYCPAIITEKENGKDVMHVWFCTNKDDGVIMDHIGYRKGVKQENGKWIFSELKIVMAPTENTWDARHTCDPAVIKGEFKLKGETYTYLMAYLGCITEDYNNNETGIAVAKSPEGPWVKVDGLNPIVPWSADGNPTATWGTGMPTLMSIDKKGEVLLTYQSSKIGTGVQRWDFSNLDNPELKAKFSVRLNHSGIYNSANQKCNVGIPDFSFDPVAKRLYVFGVTNEKNPADVTKTLVNSHCVLAYIENVDSMEKACEILQSGNYTWKIEGYVGPNDTGFARNHNPGIVRNEYGYIPNSSQIGVIVTTGHNSWDNENIFTYRLHGHYFDIAK